MERLRCLGERRRRSRRNHGGERALQHRQHHGSRSCLGSGRKRGAHQRALGRSRGGFTSKVHCLGDARGRPIAFHLTPGEAADCKAYDTLIDLPEQAPDALLADKAYDTDAIRADLKERGIKPVIPPKSNRTATIRYSSKRLYRQRNCIERAGARPPQDQPRHRHAIRSTRRELPRHAIHRLSSLLDQILPRDLGPPRLRGGRRLSFLTPPPRPTPAPRHAHARARGCCRRDTCALSAASPPAVAWYISSASNSSALGGAIARSL